MLRKTFKVRPELKQEGEGEGMITLNFATLNVIDSDEDVTLPGAFGEQTVRMQGHGHDTRGLMIGKGRIHEDGEKGVCVHKVNLKMQAGRETYESLLFDMEEGDQPLQEWSYVFDIVKSSNGEHDGRQVRFLEALKVHSVDPVFLGAGVGTGTVGVKTLTLPKGMSTDDLRDSLLAALKASYPSLFDVDGEWTHIEAIYDGSVVADVERRFYQLDFELSESGKIALTSEPRLVVKRTLWTPESSTEGRALWTPSEEKLAFTGAHRTRMADREAAWRAPSLSDFTDESWDDLSTEQRRRIAGHFVGSRTEMPPERFTDLFGPHHQPASSGVGPVVWRAISSGRMFQLSATIRDDPGFRRHVGGHYRQFGETPPWEEERSLPFDQRFEDAEDALYDVRAFIDRSGELVATLRGQGEHLTDRKREALLSLCAELKASHEKAEALLVEEKQESPKRMSLRFALAEIERHRQALARA